MSVEELREVNRQLNAENQDLIEQNRRLLEHYKIEIEQYEKIIAEKRQQITSLKQVARYYMGVVYNELGAEYYKTADQDGHDAQLVGYTPKRWPPPPPLPPPPSSLTQQAAQMNPDEKIVIMNSYLVTAVKRPGLQHTPWQGGFVACAGARSSHASAKSQMTLIE